MLIASTSSPSVKVEQVAASASATTIADAKALLLEYGRFVSAQPGVARFCFGTLEREAAQLPSSYINKGGGCLVAYARGQAVGFIAWRKIVTELAEDAGELKRLWVRPAGRGLGLGRILTLAAMERAAQAGCRAVFLDTVPAAMPAAHKLYLQLGFEPCAAYNDNPVEGLAYLIKRI